MALEKNKSGLRIDFMMRRKISFLLKGLCDMLSYKINCMVVRLDMDMAFSFQDMVVGMARGNLDYNPLI